MMMMMMDDKAQNCFVLYLLATKRISNQIKSIDCVRAKNKKSKMIRIRKDFHVVVFLD